MTVTARLPGTRINLILCPRWMNPEDPRNHASPAGSPGFYHVAVIFARSDGTLASDVPLAEGGDSFIVIPSAGKTPNPNLPYAGAEYGTREEMIHFDGYVNIHGRLARMVAPKVYGSSFADADSKCLRAIHALLSQLTVRFNVPLHVAKTEIREISTENQRVAMVMPYTDARFSTELNFVPSPDFLFYASLYREALNSNSAIYKFLCFYKIIEGLRARRNRIASERKLRGDDARRFTEVVPIEASDRKAWLTELFNMQSEWGEDESQSVFPREVFGKKFGKVIEKHLRPMRVGIAHAVLDTGEATLIADEKLHIDRIYQWLGIAQCITRQMLKNDFPKEFSNSGSPE